MAQADLKPVYLVSGSDRPKVARALERLRARFDPAAVEILSADEVGGAEAVAACNALGLFGAEGRLVLVERVEHWKAADAKAVAAYLVSPAPDTVLALVATELRKDAPLAKECAKVGDVLTYEVQKRDLSRWVAEQFARLEANAQPEACRVLVELVGESTDELELEVEKLALWAGGQEISMDDVEVLVAARAEAPPWALTDAWGRRDAGGVLAACERLLERSDRTVTSIAWLMADHVDLVRACKSFAEEGVSPTDAMKRLRRRSEFPVRKAYGQTEAYDDDELRSAVVRLAELDVALKGGSRLPDGLELERALVLITRGRAPAAKTERP